jgi:hypothetical protein
MNAMTENEIFVKLHEAELQAEQSSKRYSTEEIQKELGLLTTV